MPTPEHRRQAEVRDDVTAWRRWGPYLADRSWGTVREDYSPNGQAWDFFTHDQARSKAFRWGEDGIAGLCDRYQLLCFAPAFWNGRDPILKERLFGLVPSEANHGEDVKEVYYYLDNVPSHAYMRFLYKYPQREFPYSRLIDENRRRGPREPEFELVDSGAFDDDAYFDIEIEYAKATEEDICVRIEAFNRGRSAAPLHVLPQLWFRNTWSWGPEPGTEPSIRLGSGPAVGQGPSLVSDDSGLVTLMEIPVEYRLGRRALDGPPGGVPLFTDNETNTEVVFGSPNRRRYLKDAFHRHIIKRENGALNPGQVGTKAALWYRYDAVPPGGSVVLRLRFSDRGDMTTGRCPLDDVDRVVRQRKAEADAFYDTVHPKGATLDEKRVQRQALAGLLWTKQSYLFDVNRWLDGDNPEWPPPEARKHFRNIHWRHLLSMRIMSVPDKWEYPWFAAWDLSFHCVALALVDHRFAMEQLWQLLFEQFLHPNGQIPAYEWEFSDLNPPVHAWAVWRVYNMARLRTGRADRDWLEKCFHKLMLNFVFWVNKVDSRGNNLFEGGFLGLDNITVFDRSERLTDGTRIEQADATGWMGMYCLNLMRIALELAKENRSYEGLATKFFQHYVYIAAAMKRMGGCEHTLWDERDGWFYDVLAHPGGTMRRIRVRSLVGWVPLFAVERLEEDWIEPFSDFRSCFHWFLRNRRDLVTDVVHTIDREGRRTHVLTIVNEKQLERMVQRLWDPAEFHSEHGTRSLSKAHAAQPFVLDGLAVTYEPAEAITQIKGGNSNWRGPIWFPTCFLLIESLRKLAKGYGHEYAVRLPCRDNQRVTFPELARDLAERLIRIFTRDPVSGHRPVFGANERYQNDPHWRDHMLFYEYFHGETGEGLGASHQTGWTALVASLIDEWRDHE